MYFPDQHCTDYICIWPWNPTVFVDVLADGSSFKMARAPSPELKTMTCRDNQILCSFDW